MPESSLTNYSDVIELTIAKDINGVQTDRQSNDEGTPTIRASRRWPV
jgi:hypothetical protein